MPTRSQEHLLRVGRVTSGGVGYKPLLTDFTPKTATIAAGGAIGRVIATIVPVGGVAPFTVQVLSATGISATAFGPDIRTSANPAGQVGPASVLVGVTDARGTHVEATLNITLT